MDIPGGNRILCMGLATVLYWLWSSYVVTRKVRKSQALGVRTYLMTAATQLKAFPTAGSTLPILAFIDTIKFITNARGILDAGVRKVRILDFRRSILNILSVALWFIQSTDPNGLVGGCDRFGWYRRPACRARACCVAQGAQRGCELDHPGFIIADFLSKRQTLQVGYTLGPEVIHNPYHVPLVRMQLNRALPKLLPEICDEIEQAFKDYIPATEGTCFCPCYHICFTLGSRLDQHQSA